MNLRELVAYQFPDETPAFEVGRTHRASSSGIIYDKSCVRDACVYYISQSRDLRYPA